MALPGYVVITGVMCSGHGTCIACMTSRSSGESTEGVGQTRALIDPTSLSLLGSLKFVFSKINQWSIMISTTNNILCLIWPVWELGFLRVFGDPPGFIACVPRHNQATWFHVSLESLSGLVESIELWTSDLAFDLYNLYLRLVHVQWIYLYDQSILALSFKFPTDAQTNFHLPLYCHHYPWGPTVAMITFFLPRTLNQIRLRSTLHVYYMWHAYYTYMHEWYPWCVFIHARMDVPLSPLCMLYAHDIWQNNLMNSCVHNVDMFIMLSLCCTVVWPFTTLSLSLVVQIGWYGFCFLDFMTYLRRSNTSNFQSNTLIWMMALTNSDWNNGPS